MEKTNQWELDGICNRCRRASYCSKPCTEHKRVLSGDQRAHFFDRNFERPYNIDDDEIVIGGKSDE